MQRYCQELLPPPAHYAALHLIYTQEVHPFFPAIDLNSFGGISYDDSPAKRVVKQAICLAASTSPRATSHLQLARIDTSNGGFGQDAPNIFADRISSAILTSVNMGLVKDRMVIAQILSILALFSQFSHRSDLSAEVAARVVSHAQTVGLHLQAPPTRKDPEYLTTLFCCVWAVDRLNAAFQGRPTLLHEHDFGRDMSNSISAQAGCFRLLLRILLQLDNIFALYRPTSSEPSSTEGGGSFPSFENLLHECDAARVPSALLGMYGNAFFHVIRADKSLATVETLYHAVVVLSFRAKSTTKDCSPLDVRETLSATSIVSIIGTEFQGQMSHMPFVPYALSLSLRVFYRGLRFSSKSTFSRTRVRKQLLNACELLRITFSDGFPSAIKVADLAEQIVREMDKVYTNILQQHSASRANSEPANVESQQIPASPIVPSSGPAQPSESSSMTPHEFTAFEDLPDLDIFEYFDSDFDLDAIDAALIENMALSLPPIGGEGSTWQQLEGSGTG